MMDYLELRTTFGNTPAAALGPSLGRTEKRRRLGRGLLVRRSEAQGGSEARGINFAEVFEAELLEYAINMLLIIEYSNNCVRYSHTRTYTHTHVLASDSHPKKCDIKPLALGDHIGRFRRAVFPHTT